MSDGTSGNCHDGSGEDVSVVALAELGCSNVAAESVADASTTVDDVHLPDTTATAGDDGIDGVNEAANDPCDSSSAVAKALSSMLSSVIIDFDSRAEDTLRSQDHLSFAIDRLTRELDQLLEDAPLPFIMQHAVKISGVRKRVASLNTLLKSIQCRLDNVDRMLSMGLPRDKAAADGVRQQQ